METVRLGYVKYLNTLPLVEGLERCEGLELTAAVPSKLSGMLRDERADLALCSIVDAVSEVGDAEETPLALVPAGMIGCDGPTLTVRLFSATPWAKVAAIHADTDSHTSVVLARVVLEMLYGVRPPVVAYDAREHMDVSGAPGATSEPPETILIIGDKVVTDAPSAERYPHQMDLGEQWRALTGLPFVYAMWMCRARDAASGSPVRGRLATAAALLDRQRRRNERRLGWIVERYAAERRWPAELAYRYVTEYLRYEVGPRERQGAQRFLTEAARLGFVGSAEVTWAELGAAGEPAGGRVKGVAPAEAR